MSLPKDFNQFGSELRSISQSRRELYVTLRSEENSNVLWRQLDKSVNDLVMLSEKYDKLLKKHGVES